MWDLWPNNIDDEAMRNWSDGKDRNSKADAIMSFRCEWWGAKATYSHSRNLRKKFALKEEEEGEEEEEEQEQEQEQEQ